MQVTELSERIKENFALNFSSNLAAMGEKSYKI
jgi:hypothetical protein